MAIPPSDTKGPTKISTVVDPTIVKQRLKSDTDITLFARLGTALLKETRKPNRITYDQFEPFIPMFQVDQKRLTEDAAYSQEMSRLYERWSKVLGINKYEPTIVVRSKDDPTEVVVLNRMFTRIASDHVEGLALRDSLPPAVARVNGATRDQKLLEASLQDLVNANMSTTQMSRFTLARMESAIIERAFVERNMSAEKKAEIMGSVTPGAEGSSATSSTSGSLTSTLDDDDD